jgi:hypothetical protein
LLLQKLDYCFSFLPLLPVLDSPSPSCYIFLKTYEPLLPVFVVTATPDLPKLLLLYLLPPAVAAKADPYAAAAPHAFSSCCCDS